MYLPRKVFGLPKATRQGHNTSPTRPKYHLYVVTIKRNGYSHKYYKVHLKRQNKSKIKYFTTKIEAQLFLESLKLNPYL
jgi:hypothetical protein